MKKTQINKLENYNTNTNRAYIIAGSICIVVLLVVLLLTINSHDETYLLDKGVLEKTELVTGFTVKTEQSIKKDASKVLVPVLSEGSKTAKGEIIATYKGKEYANYEEELAKLDKEILTLMQDLPVVYSSEAQAIEKTIYSLTKESINETSTAKMQEYKQRINNYINKRASIIGELSPSGAKIKTLIAKRNEYATSAKESNDNILAPITGIVSYKSDMLEDKLKVANIDKLDYDQVKAMVKDKSYEVTTSSIKVTDNYEAYILTKVDLKEDLDFTEGYNYILRLVEGGNYEYTAKLTKKEKTKDGIELYFRITNGIEKTVDLREVEIEIVLWQEEGLITPKKNLIKSDKYNTNFVNILKYTERIIVPVKVVAENENYAVIDNYSDEELKTLGVTSDYEIKLYDRLIVN